MEIQAQCKCNKDLTITHCHTFLGGVVIVVEPCKSCLINSHGRGKVEGKNKAKAKFRKRFR